MAVNDPFGVPDLPTEDPFGVPEMPGDQQRANDILTKGLLYDASPEQSEAIQSALGAQGLEEQTAKAYYDNKFGIDHTTEMVLAQIHYEYGDNSTPQVANQYNKKAAEKADFWKSAKEAFVRRTAGGAAMIPQYMEDLKKLDQNVSEELWAFAGISKERTQELYAQKETAEPSIVSDEIRVKMRDWGKGEIAMAGDISSEFMSGKSIEQAWEEKDFKSIGSDIGTAVAFELPNLVTQITIGTLTGGGPAIAYMVGSSALQKRGELDEGTTLTRKVLDPALTGTIEGLTEKYLGTGRIIDKFAEKQIKKEATNRILSIAKDLSGGFTSEAGATFGGNVINKAFGDDVSLKEGVLMSGIVGSIMDASAGTVLTLGDATRVNKQNDNDQIDAIVEQMDIPAEQKPFVVEAFKNPTEQTVEASNAWEPSEEEQAFAEEAMGVKQRIEGGEDAVQEREAAEVSMGEEAGAGEEVGAGAVKEGVQKEVGIQPEEAMENSGWMQEDAEPDVANINRSRSRLTSQLMTPVLSYVKDVSPEVYQRLLRFEYDAHQRKRNYQLESSDFLREMTDLARKDSEAFTKLDSALLNENFAEAEKYISKESVTKVRQMLETAANDMEQAGLAVERKEGYFPRRVKDYDGLTEELGGEIKGEIDKAINEQMRKAKDKGYTLNEEEVGKIVNSVLSGSYVPVGGRKPRALKRRTIDEVTPDLAQYYYDSAESLMMWINDASDVIETRKFFGKDLKSEGNIVDINESVGDVIAELTERDSLSPQDQNKLIGALRARFGYRPTGKRASQYKSLVAMTTLGQVQNAVTQFGDATWSFYESGVGATVAATLGKKRVTMEDLAVEEVAEEFKTPSGLNSVVNTLFKYTGLKRIDRLGKETLVNAAIDRYEAEAKTGKFSRDRQERLDVLFGDNQQSVINDLKSGEVTDDVKYLAFATLLDWQPVTLSNMPIKYLEMPNGRVLYTLKTFTIKQLDNFRDKAADDIVEGIETGDAGLAANGMKKLMRIAGLMYLCNIPIDLLKDWLSGKDISWTDTMIDNLYKMVGLSRFAVEYATQEGRKPTKVLPETLIPPLNFIDIPATDVQNIISKLREGEDIDLMNLESWQMLPFVGRTIYWKYGKGEEKEAKRRERERNKD